MERVAVESSQIASVGYAPDTRTLEIEFKSKTKANGVYQYKNVPQTLFDGFLAADSKGRFFGQFIRGAFEYSRLPEQKAEATDATASDRG